MYFSAISLLLVSTVLHVHTSNVQKPSSQIWKDDTRTQNGEPDDHSNNCFCYPKGSLLTINDLLDLQNNGLERLVIYLYKNIGSNEIKMYTANSDKQVLIPDIPYESGDALVTVTTENVATLFYNNPHRIKIYNSRFEKLNPMITESLPIGLHQGSIENVYPNDANTQPENLSPNLLRLKSAQEIIDRYHKNDANKQPENWSLNLLRFKSAQEIIDIYHKNDSNKQPENLAPKLLRLKSAQEIIDKYHKNDANKKPENLSLNLLRLKSAQEIIDQYNKNDSNNQPKYLAPNPLRFKSAQEIIDIYHKNYSTNQPENLAPNLLRLKSAQNIIDKYHKNDANKQPKNLSLNFLRLKSAQEIIDKYHKNDSNKQPEKLSLNLLRLKSAQEIIDKYHRNDANKQLQNLAPNLLPSISGQEKIQKYRNKIHLSNSGGHKGFNKVKYSNKNPDLYGEVFTYKLSSDSTANNYKPYDVVTFTMWFNNQMQRFKNINMPQDIKTVDNNLLRLMVQEILLENYIYVNSAGIISDSKGTIIDPSNLELRPVFLGDKFQQISLTSITLPKHLAFLEGILVTFVNPPQVLGIIPLGKTYLRDTKDLPESISGSTTINDTEILLNSYKNDDTASYSNVANSFPIVKEAYTGANMDPISSLYSSGKEVSSSYSNVYTEPVSESYSYSTMKSNYYEIPYSNTSEVSYWNSEPYVVSQETHPPSYWNVPNNGQLYGFRRKLSKPKIEHHYEPPILKNKKIKTTKEDEEDDTSLENLIKISTSESGRRFPKPSMTGIMKTLLYLLHELPSRRDFNSSVNSTEEVNIVNESENLENGDGPDFRIIGGNAATGSGTPLSNKGRTGFVD